MCGIVGILKTAGPEPVGENPLRRMLAAIQHRGPDQFGLYLDRRVGLGSARLSIIDQEAGQQPIANEDGTLWIVFNGEIFNYVELRPELESRGHRFATATDTEVLLHAYEEFGAACLDRLNGQFAFAIWDARAETLFLARDRLGVRPLFYTTHAGRFRFASEIKAILTDRAVPAEIDPAALDQVFTFWSPQAPHTIFRDILELPPGHHLTAQDGRIQVERYWNLRFPSSPAELEGGREESWIEETVEAFSGLLTDATRIRLRADVPVGAYLSGGMDSSLIASMARRARPGRLKTFSIAFADPEYDESAHQDRMARFLGTDHEVVRADYSEIGDVFPDVIWHTEAPLTRTAPAPMFLLSRRVRDCGFKVVLTGEGADEFLAGYDIFKEAKIRRYWAQAPDSQRRPRLLRRLYRDIAGLSRSGGLFLPDFFRQGLLAVDAPAYSHALRWRNNRRACRFFTRDLRRELGQASLLRLEQQLDSRLMRWTPLARAQYLEIRTFLSPYLLSSQGDRMAMAHSVEGRFPFLDYRLVEFCNRLPDHLKLRVLQEKYLLRRLARRWLPEDICRRPKRPYRAPIRRCFFDGGARDYARELLSPEKLRATGLFDLAAVGQFLARVEQGTPLGETDEMALVGILSTQLLHHRFIAAFDAPRSLSPRAPVKVGFGSEPLTQEYGHAIHEGSHQH